MLQRQLGFFGNEAPVFDPEFRGMTRIELAPGAWLEHVPGWLRGDASLFELLLASTRFRSETRKMYEREVEVPRVYAALPADGPGHPVLWQIQAILEKRYREPFERVSVALYRDGRDSVAFHGDYVARKLPEALVASVSLGGPRRFLVRPTGGGRSLGLTLGPGDLLVMGGTTQRTHQHAIPKVAHAEPRMAVMFRPVWLDPDDASR
ncbi:MAG: alpha-ketoglutarate-dependent dioxygenase AlkB [Myxococcota bacterium]|nr:alpha-ketoglutarate-dependent dioxygenase AlkB [Myxococcota bacterium]